MPTLGMEVHPRTPVLAVEFAGLAAKAAAAERFRQALPRPFRSSCARHMPPAAGIRERPPFCPAFGIEAAGGVLLAQPRGFVGKIQLEIIVTAGTSNAAETSERM